MRKVTGPQSPAEYVAGLKTLAAEVRAGKVNAEDLESRARSLRLDNAQLDVFWLPENAPLRLQEREAFKAIADVMPKAVMWTFQPQDGAPMHFTAAYHSLSSIVYSEPHGTQASQDAIAALFAEFPTSPTANQLRNENRAPKPEK